jgi:tripartite-type tricarboxylate transporter receptor subunit TctC
MIMRTYLRRARRHLVMAALTVAAAAHGQSNPIKLVVPFPAGGVTDQAARLVGEKMAQQLGQTVLIDNKPGAGGRIAIDYVMKAAPDGDTLLFTNTSYSILPIVDAKVRFDPVKAFVPVSMSATYGLQVVTSSKTPAASMAEFIAYARKNPGKLSYGSAGVGSGTHFAGEYFKAATGSFLVHIPYKSTTGALNEVAGGLLDLAFDASARPLIDAGKVKLLAVTSAKRDPRFPGTPTVVEAGVKGYVLESWVGLFAPVGTPAAAIERLNKAAGNAVADPAVQKRFAEMGLQAHGGPSSKLGNAIRDELVLYRKIAADAKLNFE